jgi:hypothetical protein
VEASVSVEGSLMIYRVDSIENLAPLAGLTQIKCDL